MEKKINLNTPIFNLVKQYPEVKDIMVEIGFKNIAKPTMINTVGKYMNISTGAKTKKIDLELIKKKFEEHNFIFEE
ncbi:DUF1858 domain-containing protein [Mycoplasmatota bacterium WC44]